MTRPQVRIEDVLDTYWNHHHAMTAATALAAKHRKRMFVRPVHYNQSHIRGWVYFILDSDKQQWQP